MSLCVRWWSYFVARPFPPLARYHHCSWWSSRMPGDSVTQSTRIHVWCKLIRTQCAYADGSIYMWRCVAFSHGIRPMRPSDKSLNNWLQRVYAFVRQGGKLHSPNATQQNASTHSHSNTHPGHVPIAPKQQTHMYNIQRHLRTKVECSTIILLIIQIVLDRNKLWMRHVLKINTLHHAQYHSHRNARSQQWARSAHWPPYHTCSQFNLHIMCT